MHIVEVRARGVLTSASMDEEAALSVGQDRVVGVGRPEGHRGSMDDL